MEEYTRLEEEKARRHGKVYNWKIVTYGKIWYDEDVHDLRSVETKFPTVVYNDALTSEVALSCEPTVSPLNDNLIDFRISFDESDDEDYMVIYDTSSFSFKIISFNDLKMDPENDNDKLNMPSFSSSKPTVEPTNVESLELVKSGSAFIQSKMSKRIEDPRLFTLPYGTKSYHVGIVRDVEVHTGRLKLLNGFYVIDMKKDPKTPLLVGRGFLATANAFIDCRKAKIAVRKGITRLGHPFDQAVDVLHNELNFTKDSKVSPCDICHKAKQTIEPFPISDHQTTSIGKIVHLDMLSSFVINSKSTFELVYGFKSKLSYLRSFGCLCFSSVLNNSDKFSSRYEKGVLICFSTTKKAYKVYSLDSKLISYSRDVKFYETIFPSKMNSKLDHSIPQDSCDNGLNNINFFDERQSNNQSSYSPYDEGRVTYAPNYDGNDQPCTRGMNEFNGSEADFATFMGDNPSSEGNVLSSYFGLNIQNAQDLPENTSHVQPDIRRSNRTVNMPAKFNDYVVNNKPSSYYKAIKNPHWIEAMNNEIRALNRNNTWTICDLPARRKPIGSKWLWKIKYKSSGEIKNIKPGWLPRASARGRDLIILRPLSKFDYSLFIKKYKVFIALLAYVDDIVITRNNVFKIEKFKIFLRKYCLERLYEYGLLAAKHVDTPLPKNTTLNHIESDDDHLLDNVRNYQKLIGDMGVKDLLPVVMYCDNNSALQVAANPVFYEKLKHFEIDVHLIREKVKENQEKDKIESKPDKNGKRSEAGKSQKQLQSIKQEKLKKILVKGPKVQNPKSDITKN
nr:hypothetical protein [Tanacetum cinerariifolium]